MREEDDRVKWETTCKSEEDVGLGIKDKRKLDIIFLEKWKWRLAMEGRAQ